MIEMNQIGNSQLADAHAFSHDEKAEVATTSRQFGKVPDSLIEGPGRLSNYAIMLYAIAASRDFKSSLNKVHVTGSETNLGQLDKMSEASFLAGLRELQERKLLTRDQSHNVGGPVQWSRARDTWKIPTDTRWQAMTVDEIRRLSVDAFALLTLVRKRRRIFVREAMEHLGYCLETTRKYLKELKNPENGELIVRDGPGYRLRTDEARTSKFQGTGKSSNARKFGARENSKKHGAEEMRHHLDYPPDQKVRKTPLPPKGGPTESRVVTKAASTRAPRQPRGQKRLGDEVALAIAETFDPGPEVVDLVTAVALNTPPSRFVNRVDWLAAVIRGIGPNANPDVVAKAIAAFDRARVQQRVVWLPAPIEVVAVYRAAASRLQLIDEARRELELAEAELTEWREKHARLKCELDAADGLLPMSIELARAEVADALKRANSGERGIDGVVMDIAAGTRNKIPKIISVTGLPEHCADPLKWIAFKFGETALPAILEAHNAQRSYWDHREPDRNRIDRLRKESQVSTSDFAVVWPEQLKKVEKP